MPRLSRIAPGGLVCHVLNRAVARLALFAKKADYDASEQVLVEALQEHPTRLWSYAVMPNYWHLVLWPILLVGSQIPVGIIRND
jgi:putative transposase